MYSAIFLHTSLEEFLKFVWRRGGLKVSAFDSRSSHPGGHCIALGREFTEISNWYTDNRLTVNVKKTKLLLAGSKRMLSLFEDFELQPNGTQIECVQSFKYLGVTTDAKWSWKPHISNLLKKLGHRLSSS